MGSSSSDMTESEFRQEWVQRENTGETVIWQNKRFPDERLEQFRVRDGERDYSEKLYKVRNSSQYIVKGYHLANEGFSCSADYDTKKIFVEVIRLRLSEVEHIPYPDAFHLYKAVVTGFMQLSQVVGYFSVDEDQIAINEKGQVKVWLSSNYASDLITGVRIDEHRMVADILRILYSNVNHESRGKYPHIAEYIGTPDRATFRQIRDKINLYLKTNYYEGQVPEHLSCVFQHGGVGEIRSWVDSRQGQYGLSRGDNGNIRTSTIVREQPPRFSQVSNGAPRVVERVDAPRVEERIVSEKIIERPAERERTIIAQRPVERERTVVINQERPIEGSYIARPVENRVETKVENRGIRIEAPVERRVIETRVENRGRSEVPVENRVNRVNFVSPAQGAPVRSVISSPPTQPRGEYRVVENQRVERPPQQPGSIIIQPQVSQPLNIETRVAAPSAPVRFNEGPAPVRFNEGRAPVRFQEGPAYSNQVFTNPPQVVESVSYGRAGERTTSNILDNMATQLVPERKSDSLVVSAPESKPLQQERVISQTYTIREDPEYDNNRTEFRQTESNWQTYNTQNQTAPDLALKGRAIQSFNDEDRGLTNKYSYIDNLSGAAFQNKFETRNETTTGYETKNESTFDFKKYETTSYEPIKYETTTFEPTKYESTFETKKQDTNFAPTSDGKSSPEFLAFLNELKSGKNNETSSYNVTSSPSYLSKNQQLGTNSNVTGGQTYGTTETSTYGQYQANL